jgi:hypothetical protein
MKKSETKLLNTEIKEKKENFDIDNIVNEKKIEENIIISDKEKFIENVKCLQNQNVVLIGKPSFKIEYILEILEKLDCFLILDPIEYKNEIEIVFFNESNIDKSTLYLFKKITNKNKNAKFYKDSIFKNYKKFKKNFDIKHYEKKVNKILDERIFNNYFNKKDEEQEKKKYLNYKTVKKKKIMFLDFVI